MCEVFGKRLQLQLEVSGKRFIIIHGTDINSNISGWTDTRHDNQEADALLLCVINKLVQLPKITSEVSSLLLKYAIRLYLKRQKDQVRYADLVDIGKLRWKLYTKHKNDMLASTNAALRFQKMRAK